MSDNEWPAGWTDGAVAELTEIASGRFLRRTEYVQQRTSHNPYPVAGAGGPIGWTSRSNERGPLMTLGRVGACGALRTYDSPAWVTDNALIVRPHLEELRGLLGLYFLTVPWGELNSGSSQPLITQSVVRALRVPLPPLAEQRRIVAKVEALLAAVSTARERLARVPSILKRFRQSVLAAASSGQLTKVWRQAKRNAAREDVGIVGEDGPSGWRPVRIEDVVDCLDHLRRPVNHDERIRRPGAVPYYGANGRVGWIDTHIFDEELVLVVEDETFIGREKPFSYLIRGKAWVNNHAHVLRSRDGVSAAYLNYCLSYYDFVPLTSGTTGRRKLTKRALMDAPLRVAPLPEQREIVRRVDRLLRLADAIEQHVATCSSCVGDVTQSILAKAFRGELVPTEAELARREGRDYEPASKLLERLARERDHHANEEADSGVHTPSGALVARRQRTPRTARVRDAKAARSRELGE